jgi:hypothetical protein
MRRTGKNKQDIHHIVWPDIPADILGAASINNRDLNRDMTGVNDNVGGWV